MVTLLAWMAQRLQSSNKCTSTSSVASCRASNASAVHRKGSCRGVRSKVISRTSREKGSFRISRSVDFWYFLISRRAAVPGLARRSNAWQNIHQKCSLNDIISSFSLCFGDASVDAAEGRPLLGVPPAFGGRPRSGVPPDLSPFVGVCFFVRAMR